MGCSTSFTIFAFKKEIFMIRFRKPSTFDSQNNWCLLQGSLVYVVPLFHKLNFICGLSHVLV